MTGRDLTGEIEQALVQQELEATHAAYSASNQQLASDLSGARAKYEAAEAQFATLRAEHARLKELARKEHDLLMSIVKRLQEIGKIGDAPDANITGAIHGLIDGYVNWRAEAKALHREREALTPYLQHKADCPALPANADRFKFNSMPYRECSCGLSTALALTPQKDT